MISFQSAHHKLGVSMAVFAVAVSAVLHVATFFWTCRPEWMLR